jgi:hypothetical protein
VPAVVPATRVQLAEIGVKVPVEFVAKARVPVGVVGLDDVSVTIAVQLVAVFIVTELGEHWTLVLVTWSEIGLTPNVKAPELLVWAESPPYEPAINW